MAVSLTRFSWSLWGGGGRRSGGGGRKEKEPVSKGSTLNSPSSEMVKFPLVKETTMAPPSHRRVRRKWQSREERRRVDREFEDVVLVPSDGCGGCLSGSESDDSDWSIGWLEPLGSDFQSDDDDDDSFAVLVPCYRPGCKEVEGLNNVYLSAIENLSSEFSSGNILFTLKIYNSAFHLPLVSPF